MKKFFNTMLLMSMVSLSGFLVAFDPLAEDFLRHAQRIGESLTPAQRRAVEYVACAQMRRMNLNPQSPQDVLSYLERISRGISIEQFSRISERQIAHAIEHLPTQEAPKRSKHRKKKASVAPVHTVGCGFRDDMKGKKSKFRGFGDE